MAAYSNSSTGGGTAYIYYYPDALDGATKDGTGRGAAVLCPDARTSAPAKNGAACLYTSVHADAASLQVKNGAPFIFYDVRTAARNEDVTVYIDDDTPAGAKNRHGEAAKRGNGNVIHFLDIPNVPAGFAAGLGEVLLYPSQTTAAAVELPAPAAYYNSGVVAGEALPLASKSGGNPTTVPAEVVGHDKVAGAFTERRLRRELLPVLGLSVASLAVAGLAAGEPTPAAGFGLFLMLIAGLSTVNIRALLD